LILMHRNSDKTDSDIVDFRLLRSTFPSRNPTTNSEPQI